MPSLDGTNPVKITFPEDADGNRRTSTFIEVTRVLDVPLRESTKAVLDAFIPSGHAETGISNDHLAAQIESQLRAWLLLELMR